MTDTTSLELLVSVMQGIAAGTAIGLGALGFIRSIGKLCGFDETPKDGAVTDDAARDETANATRRPEPFARPTHSRYGSPVRTVSCDDLTWPPPLDARL